MSEGEDRDLLPSPAVEDAHARHGLKARVAPLVALLVLGCAIGVRTARADVAKEEGRFVEVYSTGKDGQRSLIARVDLDSLPQRVGRATDPHYDAEVRTRGVPLAEVLARVQIPPSADLALLRFDNGLQIPIAFRDGPLMARLAAFVARAATTDRFASLVTGRVEDPRRPPTEDDLRALRLHGNKVFVSDLGLAPVLPSVGKDLRPWSYADSLSRIELVERSGWEAKFDAGKDVREGQQVFLQTCAFCHGVRGAGAALGWDFVDPYPIYSPEWMKRFRSGADVMNQPHPRTMLAIHVGFRAGVNGTRTMPALRGMRDGEVKALWGWLQALAGASR